MHTTKLVISSNNMRCMTTKGARKLATSKMAISEMFFMQQFLFRLSEQIHSTPVGNEVIARAGSARAYSNTLRNNISMLSIFLRL